jgi:hypothetical protein
MSHGWIGVDLDGTLAYYDKWRGIDHIGAPVAKMMRRVRKWLADGREVRIMTARVHPFPGVITPGHAMPVHEGMEECFQAACAIAEWCRQHVGEVLPITCMKDMGMIELWDDRAVQVTKNTGHAVQDLVE